VKSAYVHFLFGSGLPPTQFINIFAGAATQNDVVLVTYLWGKVVDDIECSADFLRALAFDHVGNSLAANVEKGLDIKIVGSLSRQYTQCQ
jgi:hypothetical protein